MGHAVRETEQLPFRFSFCLPPSPFCLLPFSFCLIFCPWLTVSLYFTPYPLHSAGHFIEVTILGSAIRCF